MPNPKNVTFRFNGKGDDGKGKVVFNDGGYGPGFTVTAPDGTVYTGFIDLFHFRKGEDNCLQIVLDQPTPPGEDEPQGETFHARMYPDGRTKTFTE